MQPPARPRFWNVPNSLSLGRLALAAVVFGLIAYRAFAGAVGMLLVASLTDWLDGYLARRLGQTSAVGRQLDPLVDKVIVCGCYVYLLAIPVAETGLAPWMVTVIIARELIVQALRSLIEGKGVAFGARWAGKFKTAFQFLSILAILLALAVRPQNAWLWGRDLLTWGAVALTIYSGIGYVVVAWPELHGDTSLTSP